jgi:hypothetical protein
MVPTPNAQIKFRGLAIPFTEVSSDIITKPQTQNKIIIRPVVLHGFLYTGHIQKNGAVLIVFTIKTEPLFCVRSVYIWKIFRHD